MSLSTRPATGDSGLRTGEGLRSGGSHTPPDYLSVDTLITAEVVDPYEVLVSIDKANIPVHPTAGAYLELTLTKSLLGVPSTNLDGTMLGRYDTSVITGWQTYRDTGLIPGRWTYYGLFARYSFGGDMQWHLVGQAEVT